MASAAFFSQPEPEQDYFVPVQYKMVDLPIIELQPMQTLKAYPCKIYRKVCEGNLGQPANLTHQWKRKCSGRVKFVKVDNMIVVAAFQNATCLNRLKQTPYTSPTNIYYNLTPSQEYQYNWIYQSQSEGTISFAFLSQNDYLQFKNQWQNAKVINSQAMLVQQQWIGLISFDVFY